MRPASLTFPVLPGVALSGRYLLGDPSGEGRGDCLDAVPVPGGKVGLFVADVVGIDGPADLAAEQVRAILRERLASGAPLADAMGTLDRYAEDHPQLVATTACAAVLDTADGTVEWASAGHPAPLRWAAEAPPEFLAGPPSRPLGTGGTTTTRTEHLAEGELLALYTDGLVAFDGCPLDQGSRRLAGSASRSLAEGGSEIPTQLGDLVCDGILRDLISHQQQDDAAMVLAIRTPRPSPLSLRITAEPEVLPPLRRTINAWLDELGVSLVDHVGLGHAVVELVANVIRHAYVDDGELDPGRHVILVDGHLEEDGWVCITVADHGRWRRHDSTGRGMMMAAGLADRMQVHRTAAGTRVQLAQRLNRPVPVLQPVPSQSGPQVLDETAELHLDIGVGRLVAAGPVDDVSVEMFHTGLTRATRSGTIDACVDLDGVSHLASPGVQALFECLARSKDAGSRLELRAGPASPSAQILRLVGLPVSAPTDRLV